MTARPARINTVYSFVAATTMLDLNTPMGKAMVEQIFPYACQQLRQGDSEFDQLYRQVESENPPHMQGTGMAASSENFLNAFTEWLKSSGIDIGDADKNKKICVFSGDAALPDDGRSFTWSVLLYFDLEDSPDRQIEQKTVSKPPPASTGGKKMGRKEKKGDATHSAELNRWMALWLPALSKDAKSFKRRDDITFGIAICIGIVLAAAGMISDEELSVIKTLGYLLGGAVCFFVAALVLAITFTNSLTARREKLIEEMKLQILKYGLPVDEVLRGITSEIEPSPRRDQLTEAIEAIAPPKAKPAARKKTQKKAKKKTTRAKNEHKNSFTDSRDNKVYKVIKIGDQVWMVENLCYKPSSGTYWAYDNAQGNAAKYGYLYDWETAKKSCPAGWHLPTESDFRILLDNFGGEGEKGAYGTLIPGGTSGFSVLLGGYFDAGFSSFVSEGSDAGFWSSSESNADSAWSLGIYGAYQAVRLDVTPKSLGFSIRCLKES